MIISQRLYSTPASSFYQYLCVRNLSKGKAIVEICGYETLSTEEWQSEDDEGNPIEMPDMIDGKYVVGIEDGYLVGGELQCFNDEDRKEYDEKGIKEVLEWINEAGFYIDDEVRNGVKDVLVS